MIKNKYLIEWLDENYPLMKDDENCLIELDYHDMDKFSEWLVNKLNIADVIPMLPNIESTEFCDWMTDNGYTDKQQGTMQKGDERYCINNLFKHYTNVLTFGN